MTLSFAFPKVGCGDVIVNDVTQLNPIHVQKVVATTDEAEIAEMVRSHPGPISIGGGRYSRGGQTAMPMVATQGSGQLFCR